MTISLTIGDNSIVQFLPINSISELTPFPLQWLTDMVQSNPDPAASSKAMEQAKPDYFSANKNSCSNNVHCNICVFIQFDIKEKRSLI